MTVHDWLGQNNTLGVDIFNNKYRHEDESFEEWLDRVSGNNESIRSLIKSKKFLFAGRILANRGIKNLKGSLSNCYVIQPPEDSIESIYECASKMARTFSYGGGCGTDLSKLAPRGAKVRNTAKETSGAVSFMDLYSTTTGLIGQNGRRGALMLSLDCSHPDIEDFIDIKTDLSKITKANISIKLTDDFMRAVESDSDHTLSFTRDATGETITKTVHAKELFKKFAETSWDYAEPGALFWDTVEKYNLLSNTCDFKYAGVNPCGEMPLPNGGSCLLGSINLAEFVRRDEQFDFDDFIDTVRIAVIGLNEVLDEGMPLHPLQEQRDSVRKWRQIGLGVMGLADMLIKLGIKYGSPDSIDLCDAIGQTMFNAAFDTSGSLALDNPDKSCALNIKDAAQTDFYKKNRVFKGDAPISIANSQLLTIPPTGTLSTMLGISGGVEPIFANYYERKTESLHGKDVYYKVYTPIVKEYMEANGLTDDADLPEYFVTAKEIPWNKRIGMQAAWQKHIDASISSTVNLPESATVEDVEALYMLAWKSGLKGITIFRDGCKRLGVLTTNKPNEVEENPNVSKSLPRGFITPNTNDLIGKLRTLTTGCGSLHVTAFFDPFTGDFVHTFLSKGSTGGCANFMTGLSRMISLAARGGIGLPDIVDQLGSCGTCASYAVRSATKRDTSRGSCCPMAVGNALMDMWREMRSDLELDEEDTSGDEQVLIKPPEKTALPDTLLLSRLTSETMCPVCSENLVFEGGCNTCKGCGWSRCN